MRALEKTAAKHNIKRISVDQIKQIALSINMPTENLLDTIESLNDQGYLVKKGPGIYEIAFS